MLALISRQPDCGHHKRILRLLECKPPHQLPPALRDFVQWIRSKWEFQRWYVTLHPVILHCFTNIRGVCFRDDYKSNRREGFKRLRGAVLPERRLQCGVNARPGLFPCDVHQQRAVHANFEFESWSCEPCLDGVGQASAWGRDVGGGARTRYAWHWMDWLMIVVKLFAHHQIGRFSTW